MVFVVWCRAAFEWFAVEPSWFQMNNAMAEAEAQAMATFTQQLAADQPEISSQQEAPSRLYSSRSARLISSASIRLAHSPSAPSGFSMQVRLSSKFQMENNLLLLLKFLLPKNDQCSPSTYLTVVTLFLFFMQFQSV